MTITFRIDDGHDIHAVGPAEITRSQLAALCDYLRAQSERLGVPLIDHEWGTVDEPEFAFEARVCPLPLASLSAVLDHADAAIAVLDEAQFTGRRIRVRREENIGLVMIEVAWTHDSAPSLNVANGNAYALLESLGLDAESCGEIPLADLRRRLTDPVIHRRLGSDPRQIGRCRDRLRAARGAASSARPCRRMIGAQRVPLAAGRALALPARRLVAATRADEAHVPGRTRASARQRRGDGLGHPAGDARHVPLRPCRNALSA